MEEKGRGKGNNFRGVDGQEEQDENMMTNMKRKIRVKITQNPKLLQVLEDLLSRFMSKSPCA